jgi:hypothetical protein
MSYEIPDNFLTKEGREHFEALYMELAVSCVDRFDEVSTLTPYCLDRYKELFLDHETQLIASYSDLELFGALAELDEQVTFNPLEYCGQ